MSPLATQRIAQTPRWAKDELWRRARAVPSLDLRFAENKSLVDATTGANLVTFSRASGGTYVDSQGVIRTATTNLLLQSEAFETGWTLFRLLPFGSGSSANAAAAPTGQNTADLLVESTETGVHAVAQTVTVQNGVSYTASVYVKRLGGRNISLHMNTGSTRRVLFDLSTGSVGVADAGITGSIADVGGGWYRCSATALAASTSLIFYVELRNPAAGVSYTGDGTSGIYLWGAQLEQSSSVGEYIPTGATINSAPRFDHNPTTGESLGLLVEEQRTNLLLWSEEFDGAAWTLSNLLAFGSGSTVNATTAPNGTTTADLITENTSNAEHYVQQVYTVGTNAAFSFSVYVKAAGRTDVRLFAVGSLYGGTAQAFRFNLSTVAATNLNGTSTGAITSIGNGWYRCVMNMPVTTTAGALTLRIVVQDGANSTYTGDGTSGIYIWGAQLEAGAFPTSYIKTEASAATRSADVCSLSGSNYSSWASNTQGTVYSEFMLQAGAVSLARTVANFNNAPGGDQMSLFVAAANSLSQNAWVSGASQGRLDSGSPSANTPYKAAFSYSSGSRSFTVNGSSPVSLSAAQPTSNRLDIGNYAGGTFLNGSLRRIVVWPNALPSALQELTR